MTSKIMIKLTLTNMAILAVSAASSSCVTGVSVKAQYYHLGAQPGTGAGVFTCGVIIRELFILNIAVYRHTLN